MVGIDSYGGCKQVGSGFASVNRVVCVVIAFLIEASTTFSHRLRLSTCRQDQNEFPWWAGGIKNEPKIHFLYTYIHLLLLRYSIALLTTYYGCMNKQASYSATHATDFESRMSLFLLSISNIVV